MELNWQTENKIKNIKTAITEKEDLKEIIKKFWGSKNKKDLWLKKFGDNFNADELIYLDFTKTNEPNSVSNLEAQETNKITKLDNKETALPAEIEFFKNAENLKVLVEIVKKYRNNLRKIEVYFTIIYRRGIYVFLTYYKGYTFLPYYYWKIVSAPMMFYGLFFVIIFLKYFNKETGKILEKMVILISKASYHIFLVQMVYFGILKFKLYNNELDYFIDLFICIGMGILYFFIEPKITNLLSFLVKIGYLSNSVDKKV